MLERLNHYIEDKEFKITIYENKIHILNYSRIITLEEDYISIKKDNKKIVMRGHNLYVEKLLDNEMLVRGELTSIEVENEK